MNDTESSLRALRVTSDSMYDPANPRESFMVNDKVIVDPEVEAKDRDFVVVSSGGNEYLMRLNILDGERLYRYAAPDMSDFCLTDDDVTVTGVVTEHHRHYVMDIHGPLKWSGDDIGLCNDCPIHVNLIDCNGRHHFVTLREALMVADQVDEYGMQRITSALASSAEQGYLRPMDLDVWNEFKNDCGIVGVAEVCHA
jgi:hypothetical protein